MILTVADTEWKTQQFIKGYLNIHSLANHYYACLPCTNNSISAVATVCIAKRWIKSDMQLPNVLLLYDHKHDSAAQMDTPFATSLVFLFSLGNMLHVRSESQIQMMQMILCNIRILTLHINLHILRLVGHRYSEYAQHSYKMSCDSQRWKPAIKCSHTF